MDTDALFFHPSCCQEIMVLNRNRNCRRCFPLVISLLGMEEMPDFPIFKVTVCNVLKKKKTNRKKATKL